MMQILRKPAMTGLLAGKFLGSGQTCISPNRIYVQSGIHDAFDTEEEVIAQANQSEVGLGAYVYTENLPTAWSVAEALQVGMTGINTGTFDPVAPFGGVKESGFGVEGGSHGIEEFQISKTITLGGLDLPYTPLSG